MKPGKWLIGMVIGFAMLQTSGALASDNKVAVKADNKAAFDLVVAAVKQEMAPGGRFEFVDGKSRETLDQRLGDMQALFDQFGSVDKMDNNSKMRLYNDQELVNGILTRDDSNREVCERQTQVGSNIPHNYCRTYGEIRESQRQTQDWERTHHSQKTISDLSGGIIKAGH